MKLEASRRETRALRLRTRSPFPDGEPNRSSRTGEGSGDHDFLRRLAIVAAVHVFGVLLLFISARFTKPKAEPEKIVWMDGGSLGAMPGESGDVASDVAAEAPAIEAEPVAPEMSEPELEPPLPLAAPEQTQEIATELMPEPELPPEPPAPTPPPAAPPSELVTRKPESTPPPATPKPKAAPRPTPKPTPKATPKPTPTATPKATPKPKAKATPKAAAKASPSPTASPKPKTVSASTPKAVTPKPVAAGDTPAAVKDTPSSKVTGAAAGSATTPENAGGSGNGKGPNKTGTGSGAGGASEFGWYHSLIRDKFYSAWQQPTSIVRSGQDFVTKLKIRIAKDGRILGREIVASSGNSLQDESVLSAANEVTQIDALPSGLGGETYEVNIDFKLDQGG